MSNVLDDKKQQQICALGRLGWTLSRIQDATGIRRETVSGYLKAAGIPVRGRGRPGEATAKPAIAGEVSTDLPAKPAITSPQVSTDPASPAPTRAPSASACESYRELIVEALRRGRNAVAIWQDLVDDHGFSARYASVRRFVLNVRGTAPAEARVVITTAPGEEGQVDYGEGPMVRDHATGKYRRTRLFVFTLGCSRKAVRLIVWKSSAQIWGELHERAFRRLGGTVKVIVLDNLGEGVLTPDIYDPTLSPLYRDVLAHYGVVALPCRVGDRTVHLNGCVEVEGAYYGAPPGWLGQRVPVQWNDLHVRVLAPKTGQLLREHLRTRRGWYKIHDDDRPARTPRSTVALLARATTAGPHISAVCTHIHQHDGIPGVRRILGVLAFAKKHGPAVVEDAAKAAIEIGVSTYRFLRKYVERRPPVPLTLRQVDPLTPRVRGYCEPGSR